MIGGTTVYGIIFYQVYLLPGLTIPIFFLFLGEILVMLYSAAG